MRRRLRLLYYYYVLVLGSVLTPAYLTEHPSLPPVVVQLLQAPRQLMVLFSGNGSEFAVNSALLSRSIDSRGATIRTRPSPITTPRPMPRHRSYREERAVDEEEERLGKSIVYQLAGHSKQLSSGRDIQRRVPLLFQGIIKRPLICNVDAPLPSHWLNRRRSKEKRRKLTHSILSLNTRVSPNRCKYLVSHSTFA